jgi:hypothetical protein
LFAALQIAATAESDGNKTAVKAAAMAAVLTASSTRAEPAVSAVVKVLRVIVRVYSMSKIAYIEAFFSAAAVVRA